MESCAFFAFLSPKEKLDKLHRNGMIDMDVVKEKIVDIIIKSEKQRDYDEIYRGARERKRGRG